MAKKKKSACAGKPKAECNAAPNCNYSKGSKKRKGGCKTKPRRRRKQ